MTFRKKLLQTIGQDPFTWLPLFIASAVFAFTDFPTWVNLSMFSLALGVTIAFWGSQLPRLEQLWLLDVSNQKQAAKREEEEKLLDLCRKNLAEHYPTLSYAYKTERQIQDYYKKHHWLESFSYRTDITQLVDQMEATISSILSGTEIEVVGTIQACKAAIQNTLETCELTIKHTTAQPTRRSDILAATAHEVMERNKVYTEAISLSKVDQFSATDSSLASDNNELIPQ